MCTHSHRYPDPHITWHNGHRPITRHDDANNNGKRIDRMLSAMHRWRWDHIGEYAAGLRRMNDVSTHVKLVKNHWGCEFVCHRHEYAQFNVSRTLRNDRRSLRQRINVLQPKCVKMKLARTISRQYWAAHRHTKHNCNQRANDFRWSRCSPTQLPKDENKILNRFMNVSNGWFAVAIVIHPGAVGWPLPNNKVPKSLPWPRPRTTTVAVISDISVLFYCVIITKQFNRIRFEFSWKHSGIAVQPTTACIEWIGGSDEHGKWKELSVNNNNEIDSSIIIR